MSAFFLLKDFNARLVVLLALMVCFGVNFFYFPEQVIFGDETRFVSEAQHLLEHYEFRVSSQKAWEMPLTAIVYAAFIAIWPEHFVITIRSFQSLLLVIQALLLSHMAYMIFKSKVAAQWTLLGGLFYPFFIFYQGLLLSEALFCFLQVVAMWFLYRSAQDDFAINRYFIGCSAFFALALYTKGTLSILPPLLIGFTAFIQHYNFIKGLKVFGAALLIYVMMMSFWWGRNYYHFQQFVPFTTSSAMNLYLGNNIKNPQGGIDWKTEVERDFIVVVQEEKDELKRAALYQQRAVDFIKADPQRFLSLMGLKFKRFWALYPNAEEYQKGIYKWLSLLSFAPVLMLAVVTLFLYRHQWRRFSPIVALIAYYTLLHVIFIASLRYRFPIEPFLIVLASGTLTRIVKKT